MRDLGGDFDFSSHSNQIEHRKAKSEKSEKDRYKDIQFENC